MHFFKSKKGQSLIEYLVLVALIAIGSMAVIRVLGQNISSRLATIAYKIQGVDRKARYEQVRESDYKKKDMSDFFDGATNTDGK